MTPIKRGRREKFSIPIQGPLPRIEFYEMKFVQLFKMDKLNITEIDFPIFLFCSSFSKRQLWSDGTESLWLHQD